MLEHRRSRTRLTQSECPAHLNFCTPFRRCCRHHYHCPTRHYSGAVADNRCTPSAKGETPGSQAKFAQRRINTDARCCKGANIVPVRWLTQIARGPPRTLTLKLSATNSVARQGNTAVQRPNNRRNSPEQIYHLAQNKLVHVPLPSWTPPHNAATTGIAERHISSLAAPQQLHTPNVLVTEPSPLRPCMPKMLIARRGTIQAQWRVIPETRCIGVADSVPGLVNDAA